MAKIFVFGSNLKGIHGAGAALHARQQHGAQTGVGDGPTGSAYAIPTKRTPTHQKRQLPLNFIKHKVFDLLQHAKDNPQNTYQVTCIGCGLAGYKHEEIGPMFEGAPANIELPLTWEQYR